MSLLVFRVLFTGLLNLLGVFTILGEVRDAKRGDSGTLKVELFSTTLHFAGEGDHVTLFLGLRGIGLLSRCIPAEELHSTIALTGVLRIPFKGVLAGLCLVGVCTTRGCLVGDLKGLPLRDLPCPQGLPISGISATEKTCILDDSGVLGVPGV